MDREEILAASEPSTNDKLCVSCDKVFANAGAKWMHDVKRHKQIMSTADKRMYAKGKCPEMASNSNSFQCSDCPKVFKARKLLVQHFQKVHKPRNFICQGCSKTFALLRDVRYHQTKVCKQMAPIDRATMTMDVNSHYSRTVETQTEFVPIAVSDACAQVYMDKTYYGPLERATTMFNPQNHVVMQHQQTQQSSYFPVGVASTATYTDPHDWVQSAETQTLNASTSSIGTITPMWTGTDSGHGYVAEISTQTWLARSSTNGVFPNSRQTTDNYSMTDEQYWR